MYVWAGCIQTIETLVEKSALAELTKSVFLKICKDILCREKYTSFSVLKMQANRILGDSNNT